MAKQKTTRAKADLELFLVIGLAIAVFACVILSTYTEDMLKRLNINQPLPTIEPSNEPESFPVSYTSGEVAPTRDPRLATPQGKVTSTPYPN